MQVGNLVKSTYDYQISYQMTPADIRKGVIIETDVNMWGEEVTPSGVRIMWSNDEIEIVYEDEIEVMNDRRYS